MTELVPTSPRPLAIDKRGRAFQVPESATHWLVLENTRGRPRAIEDEDGNPTVLDIDADIDDLSLAVNDETELILVPLDESGKKLPMRAHVSLAPDTMGGWQFARPAGDSDNTIAMAALQHMFSLNNRLIAVTESNAMVFHNALKTMADAVTELQRGSVGMLEAANTTIRVANGVEALEREQPPQVDVEDLAEQLEDTLLAAAKGKQGPSVWMTLATTAFQHVASVAKDYLNSDRGKADAAKFEQAKAKAEQASQPAPQAEPKPEAKPETAGAPHADAPVEPDVATAEPEPDIANTTAEPTAAHVADAPAALHIAAHVADAPTGRPAAVEPRVACATPPPWFSTSTSTASESGSYAMHHPEPVTPDPVTAPTTGSKPAPELDTESETGPETAPEMPNAAEPDDPRPPPTPPTFHQATRAPLARAPADTPVRTTPTDPSNKDDPDAPDPATQ